MQQQPPGLSIPFPAPAASMPENLTDHRTSSLVADLEDGEHLIIWIFRRLAVTGMWCPLIDHEISRHLKKHGPDIRDALQRFLAHLSHQGRRRLRVGMPGFPILTSDEQLLMAILAAAQDQNPDHLRALLPFLLGRAEIGGLLTLVTVIGLGFAMNGLMVRHPAPLRGIKDPEFGDDSPAAARQDKADAAHP